MVSGTYSFTNTFFIWPRDAVCPLPELSDFSRTRWYEEGEGYRYPACGTGEGVGENIRATRSRSRHPDPVGPQTYPQTNEDGRCGCIVYGVGGESGRRNGLQKAVRNEGKWVFPIQDCFSEFSAAVAIKRPHATRTRSSIIESYAPLSMASCTNFLARCSA